MSRFLWFTVYIDWYATDSVAKYLYTTTTAIQGGEALARLASSVRSTLCSY